METKFYTSQGEEKGTVKLPKGVFGATVNETLLWEGITMLRDNQRQGTAKAKNRAEVSGGGKKPWRQKGIGWARHGSTRSPIWRKGGVVFGPKPRDYYAHIPQKKRLGALISALSLKAGAEKVAVFEDIAAETPKTKPFAAILARAGLGACRVLIGVESIPKNLNLAVRNLRGVSVRRIADLNCYDVMAADVVVLTKGALGKLEQRCATKK